MLVPQEDPLGDVDAFALLGDPRRRRLYDYVVGQARAVGRDEAAAATEIPRQLAAYHLDKLAAAGLLDVTFARRNGRAGPGAGRPAKHYVRAQRTLAAQTPARDYAFVAHLLAEAADRAGPAHADTVVEIARERGRELGAELTSAGDLEAALAARGYEPRRDDEGAVRLHNCPFHAVAQAHAQLVCGANLAFVQGLLEGARDTDHVAELDPSAGRCCIAIRERRKT